MSLLPDIHTTRTPGGEALVCLLRREAPLLHLVLLCPGGLLTSPPAVPGLPTLAAALLREGPAGLGPGEWHHRLDHDAVDIAVAPLLDTWQLQASFLAEDLERAGVLLRQLLSSPALPRSEWRQIVRTQRAAVRQLWAQPLHVCGCLSSVQGVGRAHPNGRIATEADLARASYQRASAVGRTAFARGDGLVAVLAGDVEPDQGHAWLQSLLDVMPDRCWGIPEEPEPRPSTCRTWLMDHRKIDQAYYVFARPGVRAGDPERVALGVANHAIGGGGLGSRLMKRIRAEMGHTYAIHSVLAQQRVAWPFTIRSSTRAPDLGCVLRAIRDELASVATRGLTQEECAGARDHLHGSLPLTLADPARLAWYVADSLKSGLTPEQLEADWRERKSVSLEAVNAAARRLVGGGAFRLAVVGPANVIRSQLPDHGDIAVFPFGTPPSRWVETDGKSSGRLT